MTQNTNDAYSSLLKFSSLANFAEYRRALIGDKGLIASGKMATDMTLTYHRSASNRQLTFEEGEESSTEHMPKELLEVGSSSKRLPGLIFSKNAYSDVLRQVVAKQEIDFASIKNGFQFKRSSDEAVWSNLTDREQENLIAKNLALLNKETATNYRIFGERLHYLTVGGIRVVHIKNGREEILHYPLLLFACESVDERRLKVKIDTSGFVNFWLDKNILDDLIVKKLRTYEVSLDGNIVSLINNLATEVNSMNFIDFKEVSVMPSYLAVQIVTGFEAEYIDPAWNKMLSRKESL